ncbi:uncharacterized protein NEMAJ01_1970 [Nematocida major]|uniref:uncharacterized protein n=1 Tax=Nematocida major TaxID=1912982 RepID=UPI00200890A3|nr:uncharacterized protein NEMAJ01_1970 [Nematocida major]KAH9387074.1 hypothetical protein NEMAJ01_1970 [Nematocida major]
MKIVGLLILLAPLCAQAMNTAQKGVLHVVSRSEITPRADEIMFDNNTPGYLYNIGTDGYIFNIETIGMGETTSALAITYKPEDAMQVKIIRKAFKDLTYHVITPVEGTCAGNDPSSAEGECVAKYTTQLGNRTGFILDTEKPMFANYFMFSPPLTTKTHAFQIFNQGQCLTSDPAGILDLSDCIDSPSKMRDRQLFMWVNKKWFDNGMRIREEAAKAQSSA